MSKKNKKKKNRAWQRTRHHIRPVSRKSNNKNIAYIPRVKHENYHTLFSNMTPDEIIKHLVEYYWNNQWQWVFMAIQEQRKI